MKDSTHLSTSPRIICVDFDGTIYFREDKEKTAANFAALESWRDHGNIVVLCTNRSFGSIKRTVPDWQNYFDYLTLDGGSKILNSDQNLLWSNTFAQPAISELLALIGSTPELSEAKFYNLNSEDYSDKPASLITKIYCYFEHSTKATPFLNSVSNIDANVLTWSHTLPEICLEITPSTTNKANAIHNLLKIKPDLPHEVITIGDNTNDYEMLREFTGYAIEDSKISALHPDLPIIPSVAALLRTQNN